jgi:hypothetical protein
MDTHRAIPPAEIPAQAGIQYAAAIQVFYWIPACAGISAEVILRQCQMLPAETIAI